MNIKNLPHTKNADQLFVDKYGEDDERYKVWSGEEAMAPIICIIDDKNNARKIAKLARACLRKGYRDCQADMRKQLGIEQ